MKSKNTPFSSLKHHSTSDWDFSNPLWGLDASEYFSSPSSVRKNPSSSYQYTSIICKDSSVLCVPQGRLVTYLKISEYSGYCSPHIFFRNQGTDSLTKFQDTYALRFENSWKWDYYDATGSRTSVGNVGNTLVSLLDWSQIRVTWWEGYNPQNDPATILRVEQFTTEWEQVGSDLYDTNRRNVGSSVNRIGVGGRAYWPSRWLWFDDTELWIPGS